MVNVNFIQHFSFGMPSVTLFTKSILWAFSVIVSLGGWEFLEPNATQVENPLIFFGTD